MAIVSIPPALRLLTGGAPDIAAVGCNLAEVFHALEHQFPGIKDRLLSGGELRRFIRVAINDEIVLRKALVDIELAPTDKVTIVAAIAGG